MNVNNKQRLFYIANPTWETIFNFYPLNGFKNMFSDKVHVHRLEFLHDGANEYAVLYLSLNSIKYSTDIMCLQYYSKHYPATLRISTVL